MITYAYYHFYFLNDLDFSLIFIHYKDSFKRPKNIIRNVNTNPIKNALIGFPPSLFLVLNSLS